MFPTAQRHVKDCGSTNDLARAWAVDPTDPAPHGALVTAEFQTQGRGRRGRGWDAGPGQSALMSFVLRPDQSLSEAWQLAFVAALGLADALQPLGLEPRVKWPNDVLLHGRKAAGILVETVILHPRPSGGEGRPQGGVRGSWAAGVGIGVNVNQIEFPDEARYAYPPTSLRLETGHEQSVEALAQATAQGLEQWAQTWQQQGWAAVHAACEEKLAVGAELRRGNERGVLVGLNDDGSARVQFAGGTFSNWASVEGEEVANSV